MTRDENRNPAVGQRRLAVIVFTDVVSFSARVLKDETRTIELLERFGRSHVFERYVEVPHLSNRSDGELLVRTFAQHAATMVLPHFVGDACSRQADKFRERCIRPA